jgi:predicted aspartyl protease
MKKRTIAAAGCLLFIAAFLREPLYAADEPSCPLILYTSLPMTTDPDGRVSVPVTVQDKTYSFLVDTGGAVATIGWDQAEELSLSKRKASSWLMGVGGRMMDTYLLTDRFSLGKLTGSGLIVYIEPRSMNNFDGTIAPDMLKHYDLDLDFAHGKMNLFSQDHCPGKILYWTKGDYAVIPIRKVDDAHIRVPVTIDGKTISAIIDTGSVSSIMSMHAANFLGITEDSPDLKLRVSDGLRRQARIYSYPFKTLQMGDISVKNPRITVASNEFMGALGSDMILGMGILRQLHLYIAYKEEKLYVTPAGAN